MAYIGDICEILDNKRVPITASNRQAGPYPYYGANGVQDYVADYIFDDELVLLAEDGGNFGSKEKPIAYRISGKCWVNNHAHVLKPRDGIDVDYLCYSLMFYDVTGLVNGATRQKLTQSDMRKMEIPLPPLDEQRKIAAVLDKVSDLIAKRRQQLDKLDLLVKSQFIEMFGDEKYPELQLENYINIIDGDRGKNYPKGDDFFDDEYCLFLNAKNVTKEGFHFEEKQFITREKDNVLRKGKLNRGDIVLTTRGTVGNIAFYDDNVPYDNMRINSGMVILRPSKVQYDQVFFVCAFKNKLADILRSVTGSAQPQLPISILKNIKIVNPPIELQNQFAAFVQQVDKSKSTIRQSLKKLETLKKSLMQEYFG